MVVDSSALEDPASRRRADLLSQSISYACHGSEKGIDYSVVTF